jgi:hypothetical protein
MVSREVFELLVNHFKEFFKVDSVFLIGTRGLGRVVSE